MLELSTIIPELVKNKFTLAYLVLKSMASL